MVKFCLRYHFGKKYEKINTFFVVATTTKTFPTTNNNQSTGFKRQNSGLVLFYYMFNHVIHAKSFKLSYFWQNGCPKTSIAAEHQYCIEANLTYSTGKKRIPMAINLFLMLFMIYMIVLTSLKCCWCQWTTCIALKIDKNETKHRNNENDDKIKPKTIIGVQRRQPNCATLHALLFYAPINKIDSETTIGRSKNNEENVHKMW